MCDDIEDEVEETPDWLLLVGLLMARMIYADIIAHPEGAKAILEA
jgi:hypothetical protein